MFPVLFFLIVYLLGTTIISSYFYVQRYEAISPLVISLFFFLWLNTLICIWEIALGLRIKLIKKNYLSLKSKYSTKRAVPVLEFMIQNLTFTKLFSLSFWSEIWSLYSLYDPSYSNQESFGFFVDVGNGWSTLVPSLLFIYCLIDQSFLSARTLGMIGLIKFYQEFYGTIIYGLSFVFNKRYIGCTLIEVAGFVGFANGLWFVFPLIGMWACVDMINSNAYRIFD